ncbi:MAG TPA: glutamine--fructose-6-phosphate transaminase (isomerizing) [Bacillota bacterium]
MCGVIGYVGERPAVPLLLDGLRRLEYRGYDSAGLAVVHNGSVAVRRAVGKLDNLVQKLELEPLNGSGQGIGHIRWATHGRPSDANAHPHCDCSGDFAVVHNGIIENHAALRAELEAAGHRFTSETDTEVIVHLIESYYGGDLAAAVRRALSRLEGSYAILVISRREPGRIVAARKESPLVVGLGHGENFIASDLPALMAHTRRALILEDGEVADVRCDAVVITDGKGREVQRDVFTISWDAEQAEKGGYDHFMQKEIHEQPAVLRATLAGRITEDGRVALEELGWAADPLASVDQVFFVACGTAYHAGLVGAYLTERLARIPARAELASEFRYREPYLNERTLVVVISQSGETADTLAALRAAKAAGAQVLGIVNVMGSSIAREAGRVLYTRAGPEIAVASTKAYTTQLAAATLLAVYLARARQELDPDAARTLLEELLAVPERVNRVLALEDEVRSLAVEIARHDDVFFIGRGLDYAVALEGQLKLKEISYIHAEAYAAGELKHGTLALIEPGVPVVALNTQPALRDKMLSNIQEVRARGARVIAIGLEGDDALAGYADRVVRLPAAHPFVMPILAVVPLQLLAYHAAVARGADVDKPRNLAKSVTVE